MDDMDLLDFIYIDLPRLRSIGSQLLSGLPETATRGKERAVSLHGEASGGVAFLAKLSGSIEDSQAESRTVTASYHHLLLVEVLAGLKSAGFLEDPVSDDGLDGRFVVLHGALQITDAEAFTKLFNNIDELGAAFGALTTMTSSTSAPGRSKADRRAGRGATGPRPEGWPTASQGAAFAKITELMVGNAVRVRVITDSGRTAISVVDRENFVEDVTRISARHGLRTGAHWEVLAQVNSEEERTNDEAQDVKSTSIMDLIESMGISVLGLMQNLSLGADSRDLSVTPLAIYRRIRPNA